MEEKERRNREQKLLEAEEERKREERFIREQAILAEKYKKQKEEEKRKRQLLFEENATRAKKDDDNKTISEEYVEAGRFKSKPLLKFTTPTETNSDFETLKKTTHEMEEKYSKNTGQHINGLASKYRPYNNDKLKSNIEYPNMDLRAQEMNTILSTQIENKNKEKLNSLANKLMEENIHLTSNTNPINNKIDNMRIKLLTQLEQVKNEASKALMEKSEAEKKLNSLKVELDHRIKRESDNRKQLRLALKNTELSNNTVISGEWGKEPLNSRSQSNSSLKKTKNHLPVNPSQDQKEFSQIAESIALEFKTKHVPMEVLERLSDNYSLRKIAENSYSKILKRKFDQSIISKDQNSFNSTTKKFEELLRASTLIESNFENNIKKQENKSRTKIVKSKKREVSIEEKMVDDIDRMMDEYYNKNKKK